MCSQRSVRILGTRQEMKATITVGSCKRKIDKITGEMKKENPASRETLERENHDELLDFFITKVT